MALYTCSNRKQQKSTVRMELTRNAEGRPALVLYRNGEVYKTRVLPREFGNDLESIAQILAHVNAVEGCGVKSIDIVPA